jgi:hypothetical protein
MSLWLHRVELGVQASRDGGCASDALMRDRAFQAHHPEAMPKFRFGA